MPSRAFNSAGGDSLDPRWGGDLRSPLRLASFLLRDGIRVPRYDVRIYTKKYIYFRRPFPLAYLLKLGRVGGPSIKTCFIGGTPDLLLLEVGVLDRGRLKLKISLIALRKQTFVGVSV